MIYVSNYATADDLQGARDDNPAFDMNLTHFASPSFVYAGPSRDEALTEAVGDALSQIEWESDNEITRHELDVVLVSSVAAHETEGRPHEITEIRQGNDVLAVVVVQAIEGA